MDALLALLAEGHVRPSAEKVAERAGISRRALFNHFTDVEDLLATAAQRRIDQILPTLRPLPTEGPLGTRAAEVAENLCGLYARVAPVRRAALLAEPDSKVICDRMTLARAMHRSAIERAFERELRELSGIERQEQTAILVATTGFGFWDELVSRQGLSPAQAERAIHHQILSTLTSPPKRDRKNG